jgi:hypothetical protein
MKKIFLLVLVLCFTPTLLYPSSGRQPSGNVVLSGGDSCASDKYYIDNSYRMTQSASSTNTIATGTTQNISTGDLVVVLVGCAYDSSRTVQGVSDGTNTYTYGGVRSSQTGGEFELWYKSNAVAASNATITATYTGNVQYRVIASMRFTGATALDGTPVVGTVAPGTPTTHITTSNYTSTCAKTVMVAGFSLWDALNHTVGSSFTLLSSASSADNVFAYRIVTSQGTYPSGDISTASGATAFVGVMGSFK